MSYNFCQNRKKTQISPELLFYDVCSLNWTNLLMLEGNARS